MKLSDFVPSVLKGIISVAAFSIATIWGAFIAVNTFFDSKVAQAEVRVESKIMAVRNSDMQYIKISTERSERELLMIRSELGEINSYLRKQSKN